ncbi:MAG: VWA domain-containing protein [Anaerolineae bacterium]|nr:VWA domain-containing protein [Thermoflexales bacterium]MDW8406147.1 VWA domain-containing protein [Anaerolineae bacterium]
MSFVWPALLSLLAIVPVLAGLYVWMARRRERVLARYGHFGLAGAGTSSATLRRHLPPALFLLALSVLIVAMARPQAVVSLPRVEGTVILAFDVSGSMAADDLRPTRMEAAKAAARDFVSRQPAGVRVGIVAFSDGGLTAQTPTEDPAALLATINRMTPQRGTSLGSGILAALNTLAAAERPAPNYYSNRGLTATPSPTPPPTGARRSAVIVLLTDGENTAPPNPLEAAQIAAEQGVRIYTVGIGSPEGAILNIEGFSIRTQLDEATLRQIAQLTGGAYFNATDEEQLRAVYQTINPQLVTRTQNMEITSLVAGAGLLILLIGGALSMVWLGRLP